MLLLLTSDPCPVPHFALTHLRHMRGSCLCKHSVWAKFGELISLIWFR
jgi:hypothetical protein